MRWATVVLAAALLLLPLGAFAALADDAPIAAPHPRPPTTVLRHVDTPTVDVPPTRAPALQRREVVVLVGGYQSCSCIEDATFDVLARRLVAAGYDVKRFGQDPDYPYDTFGAIDPSAIHLRDEVRSLSRDYSAIHIVTHSMGGVVADRAFASGLSSADGVVTYVAWSAPHSGSFAAAAIAGVRIATGGRGGLLRESLLWLGTEPDSDAARDLASTRPIPPPRGVVRLDLREANDMLVTERDARDPGVPSRVLDGALEGHGGILTDPQAIATTVETIETRRVPPDPRSRVLAAAAQAHAHVVGAWMLVAICALAVAACVGAVALRGGFGAVGEVVARVVPRSARKRCA